MKKFAKAKDAKPTSSADSTIKSKIGALESVTTSQKNVTSHPLSNHPCFRKAIDRLCENIVNLLDVPGKYELKPYWKEALVKKTPFEEVEMKEKLEDNILKVILSLSVNSN